MIRKTLVLIVAIGLYVLATGCGSTNSPALTGEQTDGKKFLLTSEPAGVKSVTDVRKEAKTGEEVVVAGQIGGADKPFTEGRASFLLADDSLKPTPDCDCPWDFCEYDPKEVAAARVSVKFVGADGKTLAFGVRETFGVKELSRLVVKGKVNRDEHDNVVVVATGVYVR